MALSQIFSPQQTVCAIHFFIIHITAHTLLYCTAYVQVFDPLNWILSQINSIFIQDYLAYYLVYGA